MPDLQLSPLAIGIVFSELIGLWLAWRIWRGPGPRWLRLLSGLVALIPFIGPLAAYWSAHFPPPHHPAFVDRQRYSSDVFSRWVDVLRTRDPEKRKQRWQELMERHDRDAG
jgi:hypothetical protein